MVYRLIRLKYFLLLLVLIPYLFGFTTHTSFEIESNCPQNYGVEYHSGLAFSISEPKNKPRIEGFDVNAEGNVLIVLDSDDYRSVLAYDRQGKYLFGLAINTPGSILAEWSGSDINVIFIRSHIIATYNTDGECIAAAEYSDGGENANRCEYLRSKTEKTTEDAKYTALNNRFPGSSLLSLHKKLIRISNDGEQTIIYESNESYIGSFVFHFALMVFVVVFLVIFARKSQKRLWDATKSSFTIC